MAKHFKQDPTQSMPRTRVARQRVADERAAHKPLSYGESASYRTYYASPVVDSDYYDDEVEARGGIRSVGRFFLLSIAWVLRLCALVGSLLVVLNSFYATAWHPRFVWLMDQVWHYVPWGRASTLVVNTPFGGKFYGGLALIVLALFVLDWILCRLRATLR